MNEEQLREALAEYAHEAWSGWMEYLFSKSGLDSDYGTRTIPAWAVDRWHRQMSTPYDDLPEEEKASDREEADRMLAIVGQYRPGQQLWAEQHVANVLGNGEHPVTYAQAFNVAMRIVGHYETQLSFARIAFEKLEAMEKPALQEPLDAPDGPGWWAFEGHEDDDIGDRLRVVGQIIELPLSKQLIFETRFQSYLVEYLRGKWYRLTIPWDQPVAQQPVTNDQEVTL